MSAHQASVSCRKCRARVFGDKRYERHSEKGCMIFLYDEIGEGARGEDPAAPAEEEPRKEGRIRCVACGTAIGRYKWYGDRCGCGRWMAPFIAVHPSKVDVVHRAER